MGKRVPVPDDFAETAPRMTKTELTEHYDVSSTLVIRWFNRSGVEPHKRCESLRCAGALKPLSDFVDPHSKRCNDCIALGLTIRSPKREAAKVIERNVTATAHEWTRRKMTIR